MQEIQINTIKDVQDFAQLLYDKYDVAFHPDDTFHDYVNEKNELTFSKEDADYLDTAMQKCFGVCEALNEDVYEVCGEIQRKEFTKRKIIVH